MQINAKVVDLHHVTEEMVSNPQVPKIRWQTLQIDPLLLLSLHLKFGLPQNLEFWRLKRCTIGDKQ